MLVCRQTLDKTKLFQKYTMYYLIDLKIYISKNGIAGFRSPLFSSDRFGELSCSSSKFTAFDVGHTNDGVQWVPSLVGTTCIRTLDRGRNYHCRDWLAASLAIVSWMVRRRRRLCPRHLLLFLLHKLDNCFLANATWWLCFTILGTHASPSSRNT